MDSRKEAILKSPPFASADNDLRWRAGLSLGERLSALNASGAGSPIRRDVTGVKRWRAKHRAAIVKCRNLAAIDADPPWWLKVFHSAYSKAASSPRADRDFLVAAEPLLAAARTRVAAAIRDARPNLRPASNEQCATLLASLESSVHPRLYQALAKAMVLELGAAVDSHALAGTEPAQRFAFFCECLAEPNFARALLEQYPVLVRRLSTLVANWEAATLALLSRLATSHELLFGTFFDGANPGPLVAVQSAGDSHRRGQAVHILGFQGGQQLVYKPRSVALESCFCDLTGWFNRGGGDPDLKEVRALDQGDFGWMEFVETEPCQTEDEIRRYFVRLGAQLALTYLIGGADLHYENVIAHGEYPVLVDLETLFQVPLAPKPLVGATAAGWRALHTSVLNTLLLPPGDLRADVSALGFREGQLSPYSVPVWRDHGTDAMRLGHRRVPMTGGTSLPTRGGVQVTAGDHVESIVGGFHAAYRFVQRRATALLADDGPLAGALGKPVRCLFRPTALYGSLLDSSYHPRFLENAIATEAFLHDQLGSGAEDASWPETIEDIEVVDLMAGDIPYFSSRVGSRSPVIGGTATDYILPADGWLECRKRLQSMNEADLERQTWLTRVAMTDLAAPPRARDAIPSAPLRSPPRTDDLVAVAARIGDRICQLAITDGERATWLVPHVADKKRLVMGVAGIGLCNGLPGIALFLGQLGAITGEPRYIRVAAAATAEALALYETAKSEDLSVGAYEGIGGFAFALVLLAECLDRPDLAGKATAMLRRAARGTTNPAAVDIMSGQAGFLVAALAVYHKKNDIALIGGLDPVAKRLYRLATAASRLGALKLPPSREAGIAHGRAGIGFALSRWADAVSQAEYNKAANRLILADLERIDEGTHPRLAPKLAKAYGGARLGWCRGVLGIALMALQTKNIRIGRDPKWLNTVADEIIAQSAEGPLCLCHGALGHLEFLTAMAERGMLRDRDGAAAWRARLLARLGDGDWVADDRQRHESPSFMLGLAGTGHALLRAAQQSMSSVLTLTE